MSLQDTLNGLSAQTAQAALEAALLDKALADKNAEIAALRAKVVEGGGSVPLAEPPPLEVYSGPEELQERGFPHWPDTDDTKRWINDQWMTHGLTGGKTEWPPKRNVILAELGMLRNVEVKPAPYTGGGSMIPDYYAICHLRMPDVCAKVAYAIVQSGDDSYESDVNDIQWMCQYGYIGEKLNKPLSTWRSDYLPYARLLAEARPELAGSWDYSRIPVIGDRG